MSWWEVTSFDGDTQDFNSFLNVTLVCPFLGENGSQEALFIVVMHIHSPHKIINS